MDADGSASLTRGQIASIADCDSITVVRASAKLGLEAGSDGVSMRKSMGLDSKMYAQFHYDLSATVRIAGEIGSVALALAVSDLRHLLSSRFSNLDVLRSVPPSRRIIKVD